MYTGRSATATPALSHEQYDRRKEREPGQCAQPCRLPWRAEQTKKEQDILSLKDLCTIRLIPELVGAGITSFKIEGRMKQPSYVETVTSMYRKYTDLWAELEGDKERFRVSREDQRALLGAYTRRGYTDGYYTRTTAGRCSPWNALSRHRRGMHPQKAGRKAI